MGNPMSYFDYIKKYTLFYRYNEMEKQRKLLLAQAITINLNKNEGAEVRDH